MKMDTLKVTPSKLLALFLSGSIFSLLIILILVYFGMTNIFQTYFINEAKRDSVTVASAIELLEKNVLLNQFLLTKKTVIQINQYNRFDKRIRQYLKKFDVNKIKVFNNQHKIVYSTDKKIVGIVDHDNKRLMAALSGETVTNYKQSSQLTDLQNETRLNVDVVETYVPIYSQNHNIIGSFEIYLDITKYRHSAILFTYFSAGVIGLLLLCSFFFLFLLMRYGVRQINRYENILTELAIRDPLTNLFNRRELMARVEEEFLRAKRNSPRKDPSLNLAFIMLDIDHFKEINDVHGHLAGDNILKTLAERIKTTLRQYDIFGRYGGEEFLIVLVDANCTTIKDVANRILNIIRSTPFIYLDKKIPVTVSLGVATVAEDDESPKSTIDKADQALYKAKDSGRNQIQEAESCCHKASCT